MTGKEAERRKTPVLIVMASDYIGTFELRLRFLQFVLLFISNWERLM